MSIVSPFYPKQSPLADCGPSQLAPELDAESLDSQFMT
jgi:hypothetical protein